MENTAFTLSALFFAVYMFFAEKGYIHILQLNSYRPERYLRWMGENKMKAAYLRAVILLFSLIGAAASLSAEYFALAALMALSAPYKVKKAKKPLVYTMRVKRLFAFSYIPVLALIAAAAFAPGIWKSVILIAGALLTPWVVLLSLYISLPVESAISRHFVNDAKKILAGHKNLKIIGVTGSYGKTSMKYALTTLLSEKYSVLMTPGSYNTTMGVVRTIREQLKSTHQIFVVEMGAKNAGDIKEICDLVHPDFGVITSVGPQHLETFGTVDNVCRTKFELADAVDEKGGTVFLNAGNEYIREYIKKKKYKNTVTFGTADGADFKAENISYSGRGAAFSINGQRLSTSLLGDYSAVNIAGAYAVASSLGVDKADIAAAVRKLKAPEHRLSLIKNPRYTVIDDAYNSNPAGAAAALNALSRFPERKILVTPGMVELGSEQERLNTEFGREAAGKADYIVLVGEKQAPPIKKGVLEAGFPEDRLYVAADISDALAFVYKITDVPSVVLLENDLPDNFL